MSDIFNNFDSNGAGDESQDIIMASPSQSSPLANSNSNSAPIGALSGTSVAGGSTQNISSAGGSSAGGTAPGAASGKSSAGAESQPIVTKPRLTELVRDVDPNAQLDEDVEEMLLQMTDDLIEDLVKSTCTYAKHRKSSKVEVRDVQLHLERKWNMWIPGFGTDELRPYKRAAVTEAHKQRMALIRKTIKKY